MALLRKSKQKNKIIGLVDLESGSAATALVHLSDGRLDIFAKKRIRFTLPQVARDVLLEPEALEKVQELLLYSQEVASRMRARTITEPIGNIEHTVVFLSSPWVEIKNNELDISVTASHRLTNEIKHIYRNYGPISFSYSGIPVGKILSPVYPDGVLVCLIKSEITEIFYAQYGRILNHCTIPIGLNTFIRTLMVHAGITMIEALSALKLKNTLYHEAIEATSRIFFKLFIDAIDIMLSSEVQNIVFCAEEPYGESFAHGLVEKNNQVSLFTNNGTVRALRSSHFVSYDPKQTLNSDIFLLLESMYISQEYGV